METRASKKRANAEPIVLNNKKQRVVLGDLPNLPNLNVSPKRRTWKNLKPKKCDAVCLLPGFNFDKPDFSKNNAKSDYEEIFEPYASDISHYLRTMEVNFYSFCSI